MTTMSRRPAGIPAGGQFATTSHAESNVALSTIASAPVSPKVRDLKRRMAALNLDDIDLDDHVIEAQHADAAGRTNDGGDFETEHEQADNAASAINNGGVDAQLTYLADQLGTVGVDDILTEVAAARINDRPAVELTPERIEQNTSCLDRLALMFQDPDLGVGVLEDAAAILKESGRETDLHIDGEVYEALTEPQVTGTPGTAEHDDAVMASLAHLYGSPVWDRDMVGNTATELARTGRDVEENGSSTWGRH